MTVTFTPKVLWVTQTQPRGGRTARQLGTYGFFVLSRPLVRPDTKSSDQLAEKQSVLRFIAQLGHAISYLPRVDAILIYSAEAARRLARILSKHSWKGTIFCISEDCAARSRDIENVEIVVAAKASEEAMVDLARTLVRKPQ